MLSSSPFALARRRSACARARRAALSSEHAAQPPLQPFQGCSRRAVQRCASQSAARRVALRHVTARSRRSPGDCLRARACAAGSRAASTHPSLLCSFFARQLGLLRAVALKLDLLQQLLLEGPRGGDAWVLGRLHAPAFLLQLFGLFAVVLLDLLQHLVLLVQRHALAARLGRLLRHRGSGAAKARGARERVAARRPRLHAAAAAEAAAATARGGANAARTGSGGRERVRWSRLRSADELLNDGLCCPRAAHSSWLRRADAHFRDCAWWVAGDSVTQTR